METNDTRDLKRRIMALEKEVSTLQGRLTQLERRLSDLENYDDIEWEPDGLDEYGVIDNG